jgi:L-lactate utilization protein LutB
LQKLSEGTDTLKSQISEQLDKVKESAGKVDTLTEHIQTVKSQSLQTLDQLHAQVQSSLASMA